jgi:multicomponent Na+:H+ antiporter subunit C
MDALLPLLVGVLFAAGVYMMLRRTLAQLVLGLALISNATNLVVFSAARVTRGNPPLIAEGEAVPPPGFADPVPQALVLTAIVISFGVLAFFIMLAFRVHQDAQTDDLDHLRTTDRLAYIMPRRIKRWRQVPEQEAPPAVPVEADVSGGGEGAS